MFLSIGEGGVFENLDIELGYDGLLTIAVYRDFSKRELALHLWSISRGTYRLHPKMETFESQWLQVFSRTRLPVHVDGHAIGTTPVRFGVRAKALAVMVPAPAR